MSTLTHTLENVLSNSVRQMVINIFLNIGQLCILVTVDIEEKQCNIKNNHSPLADNNKGKLNEFEENMISQLPVSSLHIFNYQRTDVSKVVILRVLK